MINGHRIVRKGQPKSKPNNGASMNSSGSIHFNVLIDPQKAQSASITPHLRQIFQMMSIKNAQHPLPSPLAPAFNPRFNHPNSYVQQSAVSPSYFIVPRENLQDQPASQDEYPQHVNYPTAVYAAANHQQEQRIRNIRHQLEYYFSDGNLLKDLFLRAQMNRSGYVAVHVLAEFNRVKQFTDSYAEIVTAAKHSSQLKVWGRGWIRQRHGWRRWLMPPPPSDHYESKKMVEGGAAIALLVPKPEGK